MYVCGSVCAHVFHTVSYLSIIGMFYYVLGNLRPELRSTHRAIQLIACVECPDLDKYGFEKVLDPFIKDVNTLSTVCFFYSHNNNICILFF